MSEEQDKPRIIIDEDWKNQVEQEREKTKIEEDHPGDQPAPGELPPPSFEVLASSMMTQTLAALGQFPDPTTGKAMVSLPYAQFNIGLLEVLQDKTQGNLSDEEAKLVEEALHQLRMLYVAVEKSLRESGAIPPESTEGGIQLP